MPHILGDRGAQQSCAREERLAHSGRQIEKGDGARNGGQATSLLNHAAAAGLVTLIIYLMIVGEPILLPLVIAIFVWYLINALATLSKGIRIGGKPLRRNVRYAIGIVALLLLAWLAVNLVTRNITQVLAAAPVYEQNLHNLTTRIAPLIGLEEVPRAQTLFQRPTLTAVLRGLAGTLTGVLSTLGTVGIYVVFLLLEQHSFRNKIAALFPEPAREALVHRILHRMGAQIQAYIWLKTVISLATGVACYVVMKAVGLDFAEFWALLIFALNYIPYIGPWLGVIFPAFLALVQFHTLTPFVITTGGLALIQFTGGSIIEPRLMGTGLNVSPVVMLLSLTVWGTIWGIAGMFLAVPLMVILMIVCSNIEATRPLAVLMSADGKLQT
jgi:AI-2 transport protein TqsA